MRNIFISIFLLIALVGCREDLREVQGHVCATYDNGAVVYKSLRGHNCFALTKDDFLQVDCKACELP